MRRDPLLPAAAAPARERELRARAATDSKTPEAIAAIREPVAEIGKALARETGAADLEVALYDLVTGACVFAWPSRAECAAPAACPARE